jgi:transcriptional regulator with XRE-family HTH domain
VSNRRSPTVERPAALRRLTAAAALTGLTITKLAERCRVTDVHLRAVVLGERMPSARLLDAIRRELGMEGWAFVRGLTDTLVMPGTAAGPETT